MSDRILRPALVLGLLSCIGPFAIDMYLPAMPQIGAALGASVPAMQTTITAYFIAFGLAQLVYGPWADQAGRKAPLYAGIGIFLAGSVLCTLAPTVEWLIAGRFVQGLGGAAMMVVPRAIIRDLHTGPAATRLMAAVMLVISVSPMLAPLAGSGLMALTGWRGIFAALVVAGGISLLTLALAQPETLPPAARQRFDLTDTLRNSRRLITDRSFMGLTFLGGFGMASFFVFIASASFVYTESFGLSPTGFSVAFAINAIGFFAASQAAGPLGLRLGARRVMAVASAGFTLATVALFALALAGMVSLAVCIAGLFLANAFLGLIIPTTMVMALDDHGDIAGLASSLGGTLQMLAGGLMVAATGPFFDGTATPMLGAIALCGLLVLVLSRVALARPQPPARAA
ncbi:multidrug effflux MFS transporter [Rhodobacteraceae bacterium HSP-20]|uniref:Bcr/CflA family efflux transporter n=1 Tax=Paragemmobacter amnigenus TaxID=2852097 RepID=A0ABS6J834_9RHOB|nr:multidrug effflux MFS transporter [Rhodobacter amnigenus]MBU9699406.1 multidrug effflux MFS transporter [Rhodobacter amnigenus]MBV4390633.1 multidrug effflux MFS transporter [Rhodobacter amnigenus]